jgi:hypothetical protein
MLILAMARKARRHILDLIGNRLHLRASRRRPVRSIPMNRHQRQGDEIMSRDIARKSRPSPERPVQMIVLVSAGGSTDTMMRSIPSIRP